MEKHYIQLSHEFSKTFINYTIDIRDIVLSYVGYAISNMLRWKFESKQTKTPASKLSGSRHYSVTKILNVLTVGSTDETAWKP